MESSYQLEEEKSQLRIQSWNKILILTAKISWLFNLRIPQVTYKKIKNAVVRYEHRNTYHMTEGESEQVYSEKYKI